MQPTTKNNKNNLSTFFLYETSNNNNIPIINSNKIIKKSEYFGNPNTINSFSLSFFNNIL